MPWRDRFDTVIFDLDGTLVETAPDLAAALNHALALAGHDPVSVDAVRHMIGDGARALLRRGIAVNGSEPPAGEIERWFDILIDYYWDHVADESTAFPGAVGILEMLRGRGAKLAVCTNKPARHADKLLAALDLARYFDAVLGGDSLAVRKPDAGHLLGAVSAMGGDPARAVMVGDSANDVAAARNAGLPVVLVSFGYTPVPARDLGADALIDHYDELPGALAELA